MALLRSVDNVPGIDFYEYRDKEFYNKYQYRMKFPLFGIRYMFRVHDERGFDDKLKSKQGYWKIADSIKPLVAANKDALLTFIKWNDDVARGKKKTATTRTESDNVSVFSNDLQELKDLASKMLAVKPDVTFEYTQVKVSPLIGTKYFVKEPKYKYRIYFKSIRLEKKQKAEVSQFIRKSKDLFPSSATKKWLLSGDHYSWNYTYSSSSYSLDYNDESTLSYLLLVYGELFGKRFKLEKHPELQK